MGCCGSNSKLKIDVPFEKIEKFTKLKSELDKFLSNENSQERKNNKKVLDLLIKTSNEISDYEIILKKLKKNKKLDIKNITSGLKQDIRQLKEYHTILNNLMKENEYIIDNQPQKIINNDNNIEEEILLTSERNSKKEKDNVYFKKFIRRNKKGILNKNNKIYKNTFDFPSTFLNNYENDKNNEFICTNESLPLPLEINDDNLNLIFELENGKKVLIHAEQEEQFLNVINKLKEKEPEHDDFKNFKFFDEEKDISEKIKNGEKIKDFGLTDFHLIQVKF